MEPFETYKHAGLTVELHYDDMAWEMNPRTNQDNAGKIVSFTREFDGDEYLSPIEDLTIDCPRCGGNGEDPERFGLYRVRPYGHILVGAGTEEAMNGEEERGVNAHQLYVEPMTCKQCDGSGTITATVADYLRAIDSAEIVLPLRFSDYGSSGCEIGETDLDNANAAAYLDAETLQEEWNGDREKGLAYLRANVNEYAQWMAGEVYGYVIKDADGEDIPSGTCKGMLNLDVSCWGFIGDDDYVRKEANAAAESCAEGLAKEAAEATAMAERDIITIGLEAC
jgi:hypothetical protein